MLKPLIQVDAYSVQEPFRKSKLSDRPPGLLPVIRIGCILGNLFHQPETGRPEALHFHSDRVALFKVVRRVGLPARGLNESLG